MYIMRCETCIIKRLRLNIHRNGKIFSLYKGSALVGLNNYKGHAEYIRKYKCTLINQFLMVETYVKIK